MSLEPFDTEVAELLRDEACRPPPSDDVKAAVRASLAGTLATSAAGNPTASLVRAAADRARDVGRLGRVLAGVGLVGLGGVIGAVVHASLAAPEVVYRDRILTVEAKSEPSSRAELAPPSVTPDALPSEVAPQAPRTPRRSSPPVERDLSAERRVLEIAAAALGRGDWGAALDAVERHTRQFPQGQLEEEREALAVQALARSGRSDEAAVRAARFRARFPDSPLLSTVDAALR